jgi:hypothetical protein
MPYGPSNSHDPKTDHRSIIYGCLIFGCIIIAAIVGSVRSFEGANIAPAKLHSIDDCDLYRAKDRGEYVYFARCGNGKVSTSRDDNHVITERK